MMEEPTCPLWINPYSPLSSWWSPGTCSRQPLVIDQCWREGKDVKRWFFVPELQPQWKRWYPSSKHILFSDGKGEKESNFLAISARPNRTGHHKQQNDSKVNFQLLVMEGSVLDPFKPAVLSQYLIGSAIYNRQMAPWKLDMWGGEFFSSQWI